MAFASLLLIVASLAFVKTTSVNQIVKDGAFGNIVVDAAVSRISQTCIFGDDKRFLRRMAFVETLDGTDVAAFNGGKNGGIWKIDNSILTASKNSYVASFRTSVLKDFGIDWDKVTYADLSKPLYSGLAAALYIEYIIMTTGWTAVPRSIKDQADFWVKIFDKDEASEFESKAKSFEDTRASCNVGADILFIIDESGSIGSRDYQIEKDFVTQVIQNLALGTTANQVGVITYSSSSHVDIMLDTYTDKTALMNAVRSLSYAGSSTATDKALQQLVDVAFASGNGARPKGKGHPRVGIVLTDGGSNNPTQTQIQATRVKDQDIILFSVGVGRNVYVPELEGIASEPTCLYYSQLNSGFAEILDLVSSISATTCRVPVSFEPNATIVKPVEGGVPYNCEITVPPEGASVQLTTTKGNLTLFLSDTTYPSLAYYDVKISVRLGSTAAVYVPAGSNTTNSITYCSILSEETTDVTIITSPGPITYNCLKGRNPCTEENLAKGQFYYPHDSPNKYVQCGAVGQCFDMSCQAGLVWDKENFACDWPKSGTDPVSPPGSITYNCREGRNPCTKENIEDGKFYFPHDNPNQYVQCGSVGQCFDMSCPSGLIWNKDILTCDWPPPTETPPGSGYTCAAPNPCNRENIASRGYYYAHVDANKFVQCDDHGGCFEMPCSPGTKWDDAIKTCNHA